jgi:hypothetical protein
MNKRLVTLGASIIVCLALGVWIYEAAFVPIDDPGYFCGVPDPGPVTSITDSIIVQECAAGKTVSLEEGQTIAVDLPAYFGVDTHTQWTDLAVSDGHVLSAVMGPARVLGVPPQGSQRLDEVAIYLAIQTGLARVNAVQQDCGASHSAFPLLLGRPASCSDRGHRWSVTVEVK